MSQQMRLTECRSNGNKNITPHSCSPYLELKQFSNESNVPKRPMTGPEFCFFEYLLSLLPPLLLQQKSKGWCGAFQHFPHTITTVDNSMTLTFRFYETIVEWNNHVRSTDCIKWKKTTHLRRYCATILTMVGLRGKRFYEDSAPHSWGSKRLGIISNVK